MQTKNDIEQWYSKPDPWNYLTTMDDRHRKEIILHELKQFGVKFNKALDIGAGEGFITRDLPATEIYAIEWSDTAAERLPRSVRRIDAPEGIYDLIITTGTLYSQYDYQQILKWIKEHANGIVLTSNIKSWEINDLPKDKIIKEMEFPYREYTQHLVIYDFTTTA